MSKLRDVIDKLDEAAESFDGIANAEQRKIYDEVITLAKDLDTDMLGHVKQSIANLKRLTQIKAKLAALSKDKEWVAGISGFARYFGELQRLQNAYYSQHFPGNTLSERAKEKNELLRQMAVQNTMEALMGDGLKANVTDKLNDILLRAVTSGTKFADLQEELRAHLIGKEGGQGAFARYATTYATTALSQYTGQHNKLVTEGLDTEWFMYTGSNKETTREFCEQLTRKKFIHKSEIPEILKGRIDEYQCAIYEKTGLPYGMIEGTTPENFQCNCGGWNCRHQLVPIADAVVPKSIRDRLRITQQLHEYNEKGNPLDLPTTKGKLLATTPVGAIAVTTYEHVVKGIQAIHDGVANRQRTEILRGITQMPDFHEIPQASTKRGKVYGYQGQQYDYTTQHETPNNLTLASKLASGGRDVYLAPNPNNIKSADYIFVEDGKYYYAEGKVTGGRNGIYNGVKNGSGQSSLVVIDVSHALNVNDAMMQIKQAFSDFEHLKELWLYKGGVRIVVKRTDVFGRHFDKTFRQQWRQNK